MDCLYCGQELTCLEQQGWLHKATGLLYCPAGTFTKLGYPAKAFPDYAKDKKNRPHNPKPTTRKNPFHD